MAVVGSCYFRAAGAGELSGTTLGGVSRTQDVKPDFWRGGRLSLAARFIAVVLRAQR
jgi:hypothetical protein